MRVQFEEKSYENYFNSELDRRSEVYFPLGQVQEGGLGFDATTFSRNRRLWSRLGYRFGIFPPFGGIDLREIADEMEEYLDIELQHIPQMKSNLLFQYKRPDYITSIQGKEWNLWNEPYFRYKIYKEQHDLLMHIHNTFQSKVLIIYAAPAILDVNELVNVHLSRQILDYTNFKKAVDLDGHHCNTYTQAGTYSIACSEQEKLDNLDLIKTLENLTINVSNNETNRDFILNFQEQITSTVSKNQFFSESFYKLNETILEMKKFPLLYSFLIMNNFRQLTGTQWLVKL